MKRTIKNILCFILIFLLVGLVVGTTYYAKNNLNNSVAESDNQGDNGLNMSANGNQMGENSTMSEAMAKPEEGNTSSSTNNSSDVPPEKPSEGTESKTDTNTPPEKPSGDMQTNNDNFNNNMQGTQNMSSNAKTELSVIYYVIYGIEILLLSLVIIYLVQSKFNKLTFKETYFSKDKVIIGVLSSILLTNGLTFAITYLTNNFVLNNDANIQSQTSSNGNANNTSNNTNISYSAANEIKKDTTITDKEYKSETADENALSISGDIEVSLNGITVTKTGDSDGGDNTSFYGTNSAIIAKNGATLNIKNAKITTNAKGANGVFSYGGSATTSNTSSDGTTINISDSTITTSKDNSGGIMTTGGGKTNASNLTITTAGTSSAAIRSDRGGGEVNVDGGVYKTTGQGSPSIYSTAQISVKNASLISTASEGIVIEGKNSVELDNVELTDTNNKLNGQSTTYKNIFLYQSMSGDADDGVSEFSSKDSTITTNKGDTFYITNTTSKITLENNKIVNNDETGNFLRASADSWGNSGSNGGIVTLIMKNQTAKGNIVIDSVSSLEMELNSASYFEGIINSDNSAKNIKLTLDKSSKIKLTGNSYISSLENAVTENSNIDFNGYKLYVNGTAIN